MTYAGRVHRPAARNSMDAPGWPGALHEQIEDEIAAAHEYGFLCGLKAASAAMDRAIDDAMNGVDYGAKQVVEWLVRAMDREVHKARP